MLQTLGLTFLILGMFWLASIAWVTWIGWRYASQTIDGRCRCSAFALDDGDPLWANNVLHETERCSPARETITIPGSPR
jgi:hypothetical protein